jgi:hypothetical protein
MKRAILSLFIGVAASALLLASPTGMVFAQGTPPSAGESACRYIQGPDQGKCQTCFNDNGAWTAIGCIGATAPNQPSDFGAFVRDIIKIGTGLGGGIAFLLILFSGFQTMTSAGNPEKLHEAKELMGAAISGLLLIIFSVFLLRLIGVDILQIPGFG